MAQQLSSLTTSLEDLSSVSGAHMRPTALTACSRNPTLSSGLLGHPHTRWYTLTQMHTHTLIACSYFLSVSLSLSLKAQNAQQLHERIQSSSMDAKLEALKDLASLSRDVTFAQEFINLDGISLLTQMVESGTE